MATSSKKSGESNDFSVEEKIVALYELQKIDSKIDEINKIKGELPLEVQDLCILPRLSEPMTTGWPKWLALPPCN